MSQASPARGPDGDPTYDSFVVDVGGGDEGLQRLARGEDPDDIPGVRQAPDDPADRLPASSLEDERRLSESQGTYFTDSADLPGEPEAR